MKVSDAAMTIGNRLIDQFRSGNIPNALGQIFIKGQKGAHSDNYSFSNQLIVALFGYSDARTFAHWRKVGRCVKKGEKSFCILRPFMRKIPKKVNGLETGEFFYAPFGFGGCAVFGLEQTEVTDSELWAKHALQSDETSAFLNSLPLRDVAESWGMNLTTYNGQPGKAQGYYRPSTNTIALGVENFSTFAHELVHAADDRLGNLKNYDTPLGKSRAEIVAELGGCILLTAIGYEREADAGGCWQYLEHWAAPGKLQTKEVILHNAIQMLNRTCKAVDLILTTAGLRQPTETNAESEAETVAA